MISNLVEMCLLIFLLIKVIKNINLFIKNKTNVSRIKNKQ